MKNYTIKITVEGFNKVTVYESDSKELIRDIMTPIKNSPDNKIMYLPVATDTSGNKTQMYYVRNAIFAFSVEIITKAGAPD